MHVEPKWPCGFGGTITSKLLPSVVMALILNASSQFFLKLDMVLVSKKLYMQVELNGFAVLKNLFEGVTIIIWSWCMVVAWKSVPIYFS